MHTGFASEDSLQDRNPRKLAFKNILKREPTERKVLQTD